MSESHSENQAQLLAAYQNQTDWRALYLELIYAVESKHAGETRHQTALRYIRQAETPSGACASDSPALTDR